MNHFITETSFDLIPASNLLLFSACRRRSSPAAKRPAMTWIVLSTIRGMTLVDPFHSSGKKRLTCSWVLPCAIFGYRRQLGALLMVLGLCVLTAPQVQSVRLSATGVEFTKNTNELINFCLLLGDGCQIFFGTFGLIVGHLATMHDFGSLLLTRLLIAATQLAWIPFLSGTSLIATIYPWCLW